MEADPATLGSYPVWRPDFVEGRPTCVGSSRTGAAIRSGDRTSLKDVFVDAHPAVAEQLSGLATGLR